MKRLFLLRHAKSSWTDPSLADFDRPVNERGVDELQFIGNYVRDSGIAIGSIISSPAKRAISTAVDIREAAGLESEVQVDEHIYEASPLALLRVVSGLSSEAESVLIVGHNPGLEGFIRLLTGATHPMPTAALADISFEIDDWVQITAGSGKLNGIVRPPE